MKQARMEHQFFKVKNAMKTLREELAEARRINYEQDDHLHKIDLVMENIINKYLDPSSM